MDALKTLSDKIRALAAAEPALAKDRGGRAEIARRTGASPQLVRQALGSAQPRTTRHPDPTTVRPMDGAEFSACIARIGITAPWLARLLGIHPARVRARAAGTTAVQPAEAALLRLLAEDGGVDRVVQLSAPKTEPE